MDNDNILPMTLKGEKKKASRLRKKLGRLQEKNEKYLEAEGAEHAEQIKDAKVITVYNKERCVIEGCRNYAVGKDDVCKAHGGNPLVRENLLADDEIPDAVLNGTKFDPAFHPIQFVMFARDGMNEVEIAAQFGISIYTMRGWAEKFESFNNAYEIGQAMYEAWWQMEGKMNLVNSRYNTGLFKYLTMNNLGWSDKVESKNLNVNAGVMIAPQKMEPDEWEKKYSRSERDDE